MPNEIEVKILEINKSSLKRMLEQIGAEKLFEGEMTAIFYDDAAQSLLQKKQLLRLRKEGTQHVLTFKKPVSQSDGVKIMEEIEVKVSDGELLNQILLHLGYRAAKTTQKFREEYEWNGCKVVIDTYMGDMAIIPPFIEVEAESIEKVHACVQVLGFEVKDCRAWNTYELYTHYRKKLGGEGE